MGRNEIDHRQDQQRERPGEDDEQGLHETTPEKDEGDLLQITVQAPGFRFAPSPAARSAQSVFNNLSGRRGNEVLIFRIMVLQRSKPESRWSCRIYRGPPFPP